MGPEEGFNALTGTYENLVKAGVIEPAKVVGLALQNAASVASLLLTMEALVSQSRGAKETASPDAGAMGGMYERGPSTTGVESIERFADDMVMDVEIELRIPTLTVKKDDGSTGRIDNSLVRLKKVIQVPSFPPLGSTIELSAGPGLAFQCTIARADWHEQKQLFVLACKYPRRLLPHEYELFLADPTWQRTELPA